MKQTMIVVFVFCFFSIAFGQEYEENEEIDPEKEETINMIKDQIEIIDRFIDFESVSLESNEFLDQMPDHGAELSGYYEHERLKKIIRSIGMPTAMVITTFYFWNDQIVYVNYKQKQYMQKSSAGGSTIDYENSYVKYESSYYFDQQEEIYRYRMGEAIMEVSQQDQFFEYSVKMKTLLDDKFKNRETYSALQGKWISIQNPDDSIVFDGVIRFNFYDGKFANRLRINIIDDIMNCKTPKEDYVYEYKIVSITDTGLVLKHLSSDELFKYSKVQ